jgi:predicted rRNA methylase YqxC with S4 and FtsJ domains
MGEEEFTGISANSADSATTVQSIPDSPDISLNDVSFTSMTVHMETVYTADKNVTRFDVSWIPHDGAMDDSTPRMSTTVGRSYHIYFLWLGEKTRGISSNSTDASATTAEYSDSPDISLNDVSFTSMTVHMETVYAADKNVTGFDVSWIPRRCHG